MKMKNNFEIAVGSDHAGYETKEIVKGYLSELNYIYIDYGTDNKKSCDYPDYAAKVADAVRKGKCDRGILVCGSGIGMSIVANKFRDIRAALCFSIEDAKQSREHLDSNILVMAGKGLDKKTTEEILKIWLSTPFSKEERHVRRISKISSLEREILK